MVCSGQPALRRRRIISARSRDWMSFQCAPRGWSSPGWFDENGAVPAERPKEGLVSLVAGGTASAQRDELIFSHQPPRATFARRDKTTSSLMGSWLSSDRRDVSEPPTARVGVVAGATVSQQLGKRILSVGAQV